MYGNDESMALQIAANASNLRAGNDEPYTIDDFLEVYPQFGTDANTSAPLVPVVVVQMYIDLALGTIQKARWRGAWKVAMALFIAHHCTMWLKTAASPSDGKDSIISAGQSQGIITSESVDGVSYSIDSSIVAQDLEGFGSYKSTEFGLQLASMSKLYGKGGMGIR